MSISCIDKAKILDALEREMDQQKFNVPQTISELNVMQTVQNRLLQIAGCIKVRDSQDALNKISDLYIYIDAYIEDNRNA